jgi:hypothetical protein
MRQGRRLILHMFGDSHFWSAEAVTGVPTGWVPSTSVACRRSVLFTETLRFHSFCQMGVTVLQGDCCCISLTVDLEIKIV